MSAPGLVIGAKVRCGSGTTVWVVERIDRHSVQGRSAAGRRRRIDLNRVRIVESVPGMETMDIWPSGRIEVDGTAVRYADDYYRTVVDWPAWDLGKGMIGQPSSFGLMVEGGQQPCVRVVGRWGLWQVAGNLHAGDRSRARLGDPGVVQAPARVGNHNEPPPEYVAPGAVLCCALASQVWSRGRNERRSGRVAPIALLIGRQGVVGIRRVTGGFQHRACLHIECGRHERDDVSCASSTGVGFSVDTECGHAIIVGGLTLDSPYVRASFAIHHREHS